MPRKRPRTGNRTDLATQPNRAATGQQYGKATAQRESQKVIPLPQQQVPRLDLNAVTQAAARATPPTGLLEGPSEDATEPVTAGLPFGPGPGPEALGLAATDPTEAALRALYQAHPNEALRRLIEVEPLRNPRSGSLPPAT